MKRTHRFFGSDTLLRIVAVALSGAAVGATILNLFIFPSEEGAVGPTFVLIFMVIITAIIYVFSQRYYAVCAIIEIILVSALPLISTALIYGVDIDGYAFISICALPLGITLLGRWGFISAIVTIAVVYTGLLIINAGGLIHPMIILSPQERTDEFRGGYIVLFILMMFFLLYEIAEKEASLYKIDAISAKVAKHHRENDAA